MLNVLEILASAPRCTTVTSDKLRKFERYGRFIGERLHVEQFAGNHGKKPRDKGLDHIEVQKLEGRTVGPLS